MVFCPECGHQCPDGASFCPECGHKIESKASFDAAAACVPTSSKARAPRVDTSNTGDGMVYTSCGVVTEEEATCPVCHKRAGGMMDKQVGSQFYHLECFNCNQCKQYLSGKFYRDPRPGEKDMLLCEDCKNRIVTPSTASGRTGYQVHRPVIGGK